MEQINGHANKPIKRAPRRSALKMAFDAFEDVRLWQLMDERPIALGVAARFLSQLASYSRVWDEAARRASACGRYQAASKFMTEIATLADIGTSIRQLDEALRDVEPTFEHAVPAADGLRNMPAMIELLKRYDAQLQVELGSTMTYGERAGVEREIDAIRGMIEAINRLDMLLRMKFEWDRRVAFHRRKAAAPSALKLEPSPKARIAVQTTGEQAMAS